MTDFYNEVPVFSKSGRTYKHVIFKANMKVGRMRGFYLQQFLHEKLQERSYATGQSMSRLVREALGTYLSVKPPEAVRKIRRRPKK